MLRNLVALLFVTGSIVSCTEEPQEDQGLLENQEETVQEVPSDTKLSEDIAAYKTVVNIIRETGLAQNFVILPGEVADVKAYIEDNERVLEYNPEFMQQLQADTSWHGISILARQIGHHVSNHKLDGATTIEEELEADKYAGFVLFKMGASLEEAVNAMELLVSEDSSASQAALNARIASLTKGWNNAQVLMSDTAVAAIDTNKVVEAVAEQVQPVVAKNQPKYVFRVFLALDNKIYFVDKDDMVFYEQNGKPMEVGLKRESNKPGFDWIFVKEGDSYGVDKKGRLWAFSTDGTFKIVGQAVRLTI